MATAKKAAKKSPTKAANKSPKKSSPKKNKLGVENSLVNNINARKEKGISRPKSRHTIDKESYNKMEEGWK